MSGPNVWGPHGWRFIHFITLAYPNNPTSEQKLKYKNFFISLGDVLPCHICAAHYKKNLIEIPLSDTVLSSRNNMINWAIDIHNKVNESKNKPILSYDEALKHIGEDEQCVQNTDNFQNLKQNKTCNKDNSQLFYMIGIVCILITIAIIYKKK